MLLTIRSVGTLELIVNDWLHASFDASGVITHWVHARLGRIDLDNLFQLDLASLQFLSPVVALWLACFKKLWLRVLTCVEFSLDIVGL